MPDKLEGEFILNDTPKPPVAAAPPIPNKPILNTQPLPEHNAIDAADLQHAHTHFSPAMQKIGAHKKPWFYSSLAYYPEGIAFENQEEDEEIILVVRRDFITNLPWILVALFFALLPLLIVPFLPVIAPFVTFSQTTITLYLLFYYLAVIGYIIVNFTLWYFQVGIVTNKHIIDIDVHGILSRDVARTQLSNVEDVKYTQIGVIRSIFNYGDVTIQTAGTNSNFEFDRVPEPSLIIQIIEDLIKT